MDKDNSIVASKLDILIKLTAISSLRDLSFKEKVRILSSIGLQPKEIGDILSRKSNQVSVTLVEIRKKGIKK